MVVAVLVLVDFEVVELAVLLVAAELVAAELCVFCVCAVLEAVALLVVVELDALALLAVELASEFAFELDASSLELVEELASLLDESLEVASSLLELDFFLSDFFLLELDATLVCLADWSVEWPFRACNNSPPPTNTITIATIDATSFFCWLRRCVWRRSCSR